MKEPAKLVAAVATEIDERLHTVLEIHRKPGLVYIISDTGLQVIGPKGVVGHQLVYIGHIAIVGR